jgi:Rps23 Pro-64 3,4-dihydroxylase Tpa1-like proline 4-hydroxylase
MFQFNPDLDPRALGDQLLERRRHQISDIHPTEDAERAFSILYDDTPWWVAYNVGDRVNQMPPEQFARLNPMQVSQLVDEVNQRAQTNYQFLYQFYPVIEKYFNEKPRPNVPIFDIFEFLNSPAALQFFRTLTGRDDVQWVDAQATLYQAGHFLKSHTDLDPSNTRVAAYVLNFTKLWERDWGGYLQFYDEKHDMIEALRPIFNAMNIFLVPIDHSVGYVSPFAYGQRFSVTGWLRSDAPPGPIGRS